MTSQRRLVSAALGLAVAVAATGCDSGTTGSGHTPQPTTTSPTTARTAVVRSAITATIHPPKLGLSTSQRQVLAVFTEYINARNRFESHPWIIDPDYLRLVHPEAPDHPTDTGTTGLVGPMIVQILSIQLPDTATATVTYCLDDRSVRYLGQDGAVDIAGPAGDHRRGDVVLENTEFRYTRDAATDGKPSETPRWLVAKGGLVANAPECRAVASSPPPEPPSPRPPTAG